MSQELKTPLQHKGGVNVFSLHRNYRLLVRKRPLVGKTIHRKAAPVQYKSNGSKRGEKVAAYNLENTIAPC